MQSVNKEKQLDTIQAAFLLFIAYFLYRVRIIICALKF